jgi:hypothetical protein
MSTNYRIFNAKEITTGQSGSLDRAWGIMINTPICTGTLHLEGFTGASNTTMNLAYLPKNTPIPIYPANIVTYDTAGYTPNNDTGSAPNNPDAVSTYSVQVTSGSVYLLA